MTPSNPPEPDLREVIQKLDQLSTNVEQLRTDLQEARTDLQEARTDLQGVRTELKEEVKRWDERFFQLTRDELTRANTIIITAGTVVVLQAFAPAIRDLINLLFRR